MDLSEAADAVCSLAHGIPGAWRRADPGAQLRALRLKRNVSQRHLADASGVAQSFISRLENGLEEATLRTWLRLYAELGCQAVIVPLPGSEDALDLIDDENMRREERMELGRLARWG